MLAQNRRTLLKSLAALGVTGCEGAPKTGSSLTPATPATPAAPDPWRQADQIVAQTVVPTFPDRDFDIADFGAVGDGRADCTAAFQQAIAACAQAGGGRVTVRGGEYLTGPIHLESNVNLHIDEGATIAFVSDPKHYLPAVLTRWEGVEFMGYSPLIYAYGKTNIAITGKGTLDGRANKTTWWPWKGNQQWGVSGHPSQAEGRKKLFAEAEAGVPPEARHYAEGYYFRPPFVQPYRCTNVLIEGVKVTNSPFWLLNPTLCENVTVRGVSLQSLGPNSDGCDPESCKNVVIENCLFDTGDDCIAIKSGRNNDGRRVNAPTENVVIRGCQMRAGHGGVVIGSEISGGVRNVFAENNVMSSPDLDRGFRIKTNSVRGGLLENIFMRNCKIGRVQDAIVINFHYEEGDAGSFDPTVRNIEIRDLVCEHATQAFKVRGFERAPIQNLSIVGAAFQRADNAGVIEHVDNLLLVDVEINGEVFTV